jgi:spectrin beta
VLNAPLTGTVCEQCGGCNISISLYVLLQFYAEANEAETWIREKWPLLTSNDFGKDEDSVQSLTKKLEGVMRDMSQFQHTIGRLAKLSQGLVDRGHFDSHNISAKQVTCWC